MLSKKRNDPFYWKNKLDTLECLPGETTIAKKVMWEKFENRLYNRPKKNKAMWYWLAAGLIPLTVILFIMPKDTGIIVPSQVVQNNKGQNEIVWISAQAPGQAQALSISAPVEKKQGTATVIPVIGPEVKTDTSRSHENIVAAPLSGEVKTGLPTDTVVGVDTALIIASTIHYKRKLPVVHNNELETLPFSTPANFAHNLAGTKPRKNKVSFQNIATQQSRLGFNIKLSSKN